ncbi:MAG: hypothetical protein R3D97_03640 [Paracoccaceae bacterium]
MDRLVKLLKMFLAKFSAAMDKREADRLRDHLDWRRHQKRG